MNIVVTWWWQWRWQWRWRRWWTWRKDDNDDRLKPMWGVPFVIWQEGEAAAISIFEKLGRDRGENSNFFSWRWSWRLVWWWQWWCLLDKDLENMKCWNLIILAPSRCSSCFLIEPNKGGEAGKRRSLITFYHLSDNSTICLCKIQTGVIGFIFNLENRDRNSGTRHLWIEILL